MSEEIGVKEASKILGLSKKSVYTKLRSGQITGKKINIKYGQKWVIDKEQLEDQAKAKNKVVEVKEINELVSKEDLMNELIDAVNGQNKEVINKAMNDINDTIKQQNEVIKELSDQVKKLQENQNKTLLDKIKGFLGRF